MAADAFFSKNMFPEIQPEDRRKALEEPEWPIDMVFDTDTYNEIDDQFALVYALLSKKLKVEAIYAAPFFNDRSSGPADGMQKSYEEILRVLDRIKFGFQGPILTGSTSFLPSIEKAVQSQAAEDLVKRALQPRENPLYVVAIGAITNIASAILMDPSIIRNIVVVWLGGEPYYWKGPMSRAFNLYQDTAAAKIIFDSGVPLVHVPCTNVSEHLRTNLTELNMFVKGQGEIGDYLYELLFNFYPNHFARTKVIWDICNIAYLNNPRWTPSELRPSPILQEDLTWGAPDSTRHLVREVIEVDRDQVFGDLFRKLAELSKQA